MNQRRIGPSKRQMPSKSKGKSWFFGIGINQYENFQNLNNAVKDVNDVIGILQEKYGLGDEGIITLFDRNATRAGIIKIFDRLLRDVAETDKLIIYYSGHGHLAKETVKKKGFWIPTNAEKDDTTHYIRNSTVRDFLEDINSKHTLLISDACFSGALFMKGVQKSTGAMDELELLGSRWAICSGRHNELVYDGIPGTNSPFAESIIDILRTNQQPKLNVAKFADRIIELTRAKYEQLPEGNPLYNVGHKGGQYIFHLKSAEDEDWSVTDQANSLESYRSFIEKYPNSKYRKEAVGKIREFEEETLWQKVKQRHSIKEYLRYEIEFPEGKYLDQALASIKELEEERFWIAVLAENSLDSFRNYQDTYPDGKFRDKADFRIQKLLAEQKEEEDWSKIQGKKDIDSLLGFTKKHPNGKYKSEAQLEIMQLKRESSEILPTQYNRGNRSVKGKKLLSSIWKRFISIRIVLPKFMEKFLRIAPTSKALMNSGIVMLIVPLLIRLDLPNRLKPNKNESADYAKYWDELGEVIFSYHLFLIYFLCFAWTHFARFISNQGKTWKSNSFIVAIMIMNVIDMLYTKHTFSHTASWTGALLILLEAALYIGLLRSIAKQDIKLYGVNFPLTVFYCYFYITLFIFFLFPAELEEGFLEFLHSVLIVFHYMCLIGIYVVLSDILFKSSKDYKLLESNTARETVEGSTSK